LTAVFTGLFGRGSIGWVRGFCAYLADGFVNDGEEELLVVCPGFGLDDLAGFLACVLVFREGQVAAFGGDDGELLDDVEERLLIFIGQLPALGDGAGEDLIFGPGMFLS